MTFGESNGHGVTDTVRHYLILCQYSTMSIDKSVTLERSEVILHIMRRVLDSKHWSRSLDIDGYVQARRLPLFGHIARMPDETDARSIITASPSENWRRPPGRPRTTWMKTIQQDLRSNNLCLDEAISSTLETDVCVWRYAPLVVLATQEDLASHSR